MATPCRAAVAHTRRMIVGSPAWNPHATFALVTKSSRASSSPSRQTPKPSPRSALRSTSLTVPWSLTRSMVAYRPRHRRHRAKIRRHTAERPPSHSGSGMRTHALARGRSCGACVRPPDRGSAGAAGRSFAYVGEGSLVRHRRRFQRLEGRLCIEGAFSLERPAQGDLGMFSSRRDLHGQDIGGMSVVAHPAIAHGSCAAIGGEDADDVDGRVAGRFGGRLDLDAAKVELSWGLGNQMDEGGTDKTTRYPDSG